MSSEESEARTRSLQERVTRSFAQAFDRVPSLIVAAPGRVNLIGEHTDYNDGFVLPAAIDRHIVVAAAPRQDRRVRLHAADLDARAEFDLDHIVGDAGRSWSNYERGVAWALQQAGHQLRGMDLAIGGNVPVASGLSSSAAVELATAYAFQVLGELQLDGVQRALLCQRAENEFVGMRCGIMDQYIISLGQRGHALLIDCRSLEYRAVPIPAGCSIVICDTRKRRGLVDSEYNTRRQECETGARLLGIPALRDIAPDDFALRQASLGEVTRKRCRHVVTEDQRVLEAVQALQEGRLQRFGELMNASHVSLRDDYQVSCRELDVLAEAAWEHEAVLGARMTGAGFGGCTVNLVVAGAEERFQQHLVQAYTRAIGLAPEVYVCTAEAGVRALA